jgi:hypothetical protein
VNRVSIVVIALSSVANAALPCRRGSSELVFRYDSTQSNDAAAPVPAIVDRSTAYVTSARLKQSTVWSSTMPTACMKA